MRVLVYRLQACVGVSVCVRKRVRSHPRKHTYAHPYLYEKIKFEVFIENIIFFIYSANEHLSNYYRNNNINLHSFMDVATYSFYSYPTYITVFNFLFPSRRA